MRVVLGVGRRHRGVQGLLAAAAAHRGRPRRDASCPTAAALEFVGEATWAALSGKPVHTDVWRRHRGAARADRPAGRPRRRRPGDRRPAGPGRARPGRRPAHQRPAHRPLPGRVRPGHAHRDVGAPRHPGQRRHAARARGARRAPGVRAADRRATPARAGCPSPRSSSPCASASWPGRRAAPRRHRGSAARGDLAGRRVVVSAGGTREPLDPVRYLGNRSLRQAGLRPGPRPPPSAAPRSPWSSSSSLPAPDGRHGRAGRDRRSSCRRR